MNGSAGKVIGEVEGIFLGRLIQIRVSGDDEIEQAIVIGIKQHGGSVDFTGDRLQPCLIRDIVEGSIFTIVKNLQAIETRDKQAQPRAVVKVGKSGTQAAAQA